MMFILFILLILIISLIILLSIKNNIYGGNIHKNDNISCKPSKPKYTYTISGEDDGLDYKELRKLLKDNHFYERDVKESVHISFGTFGKFFIKGVLRKLNYNPLFFKQRTFIKNSLSNDEQILDKIKLYETGKRLLIKDDMKYFPKSYYTEEFESLIEDGIFSERGNNIFILKKSDSWGQEGVNVIDSKEKYFEEKKKLSITNDGIISAYISNPRLVDRKKIHFRLYVLLSIDAGIKRCYIHDEVVIMTALNPYIKGDWLNRDIHITGGKFTKKYHKWPEAIWKNGMPDKTMEEFNKFKKVIASLITLPDISIYKETYIGYYVYAVDGMVTEDDQFFIIEVNNQPGFKMMHFYKEYFDFVLTRTVFPPLGITRYLHPLTDLVLDNCALSKFGSLLTGKNKCTLIPYRDARRDEIDQAMQFNFHGKPISLAHIIKEYSVYNIFLISYGDIIVGYLALDLENNILIAIIEKFQNRGIGSAMIAQFIEIYRARNFLKKGIKLFIKNNAHLSLIAKKLKFKLNTHTNKYEKLLYIE